MLQIFMLFTYFVLFLHMISILCTNDIHLINIYLNDVQQFVCVYSMPSLIIPIYLNDVQQFVCMYSMPSLNFKMINQ